MKWMLLILAIAFEVSGTAMMKLSEGFTRPLYSAGIFISYAGSLIFLTLTLRHLEIGIVYAIWSGVGIAVISLIGIIYFHEKIDLIKTISLVMVILGVIGLNFTGKP